MKLRKPIIAVLGHVDHGKCIHPDEKVVLGDGRIVKIKDLFEEEKKVRYDNETEVVEKTVEVVSSNDMHLKIKKAKFVCKVKSDGHLIEIELKNGRKIRVTPEHPFLTLKGWKRADEIEVGDSIAFALKLPINPDFKEFKRRFVEKLIEKDFLVRFKEDFFNKIKDIREIPAYRRNKNSFRREDIEIIIKKIKIPLEELFDKIESIKISNRKQRCSHREFWIPLPKSWKKFFYFLGFMFGDGCSGFKRLTNNNLEILNIINNILKEIGCSLTIFRGRTATEATVKGGKTLYCIGTEIFDFPKRKKAKTMKIPELVQITPNDLVSEFIKGYFDADGYVDERNCFIEFTSASKDFIEDLGIILLRFGITSTFYEKEGYYYLRISGKDNIKAFLEKIGSYHKEKLKKIRIMLSKSRRQDIINKSIKVPEKLLKIIRAFLLLSDRDLRKIPFWRKIKEGVTIERWNSILDYIRKMGLRGDKVKKYLKAIESGNIKGNIKRFLESCEIIKDGKITEIGKLAIEFWKDPDVEGFIEGLKIKDVGFVEVVSKRKIPYKEFVYDLSVPQTENFVVNGVIVHNTKILDKIRGTTVQLKEAGGITQHIGATEVPSEIIKKIAGKLIDLFKIEIKIPGLLFIDTPGHEAFTSLRERGASIADLAVLVVDVTSGFQPQTYESLEFLKRFKVPFVVAANKIDLIPGWKPQNTLSFLESIRKQREEVQNRLDEKVYQIVFHLNEQGFNADRFDRVTDFTKEIAIVPTSAITGEGIAELLLLLLGLSQKYLEKSLRINVEGPAKGTVLEKKEEKGAGTVIDVIIYDGTLKESDWIVVGGLEEPVVTKIRALLKPKPLEDIRMAKTRKFERIKEVSAAAGVRIIAPNLEKVIPGMPLISVRDKKDIEKAKEEVQSYIRGIRFESDQEGIIIRADSLGSLEALVKVFKELGVPVKKADVGEPTKEDISLLEPLVEEKPELAVIVCFNLKVPKEIEEYANSRKVKILSEKIIYHLVDKYKELKEELIRERVMKILAPWPFPAKFRILPGYVFRKSDPAIVGIEILEGTLKPNCYVMKEDGREVGFLKSIQYENKPLKSAKKGEKVAVAIEGPTVGRQIDEGDILYVSLPEKAFILLKKYKRYLRDDEIGAMREIAKIKRKKDPLWGYRDVE